MTTDYSTLNATQLAKLPRLVLRHNTRVADHMGSGCFMDPPGFPTYFLRSVYTGAGNTPAYGPTEVIVVPGSGEYVTALADAEVVIPTEAEGGPAFFYLEDEFSWEARQERREILMRQLWAPLPESHPRVQAWIATCYSYFHNCYRDVDAVLKPYENGHPATLALGVDFSFQSFEDDPRFNDDWRAKGRAVIDARNANVAELRSRICIPENHAAVVRIQAYYPDHVIREDWIEKHPGAYGSGGPGSWWETEASQPTPEECRPLRCGPHPINGSWCQWCGWQEKEA